MGLARRKIHGMGIQGSPKAWQQIFVEHARSEGVGLVRVENRRTGKNTVTRRKPLVNPGIIGIRVGRLVAHRAEVVFSAQSRRGQRHGGQQTNCGRIEGAHARAVRQDIPSARLAGDGIVDGGHSGKVPGALRRRRNGERLAIESRTLWPS